MIDWGEKLNYYVLRDRFAAELHSYGFSIVEAAQLGATVASMLIRESDAASDDLRIDALLRTVATVRNIFNVLEADLSTALTQREQSA